MIDRNKTIKAALQEVSLTEKPGDKVVLWHLSSDRQALKSFLDNGAKPIGIGQGGQTGGFFVWNTKENALSHFKDFLFKDKAAEALLIGVCVDKKAVAYPVWQFDLEIAKALNSLFFKYKDQIQSIKNLSYRDAQGELKTIAAIKPTIHMTEKECAFQFKENHRVFSLAVGNDNGLRGVDIFQAIVDTMCRNPIFKKDYDALLLRSITTADRVAVKYCGQKALPVDEVFYIRKDENNIDMEQQVYTSSLEKEKQVCPFLTAALSRRRNARG